MTGGGVDRKRPIKVYVSTEDRARIEANAAATRLSLSDYLRSVGPGETVTGRTWVGEPPRGARFDRHVEFVGGDGKVRVRARTTWAIIDKSSGRPLRVPPEVAAPFLA